MINYSSQSFLVIKKASQNSHYLYQVSHNKKKNRLYYYYYYYFTY
jgi:hypothetical protein